MCGVASHLHLSIKTAEVLIQFSCSHLTDSAHTQAGHTLTTHLETLTKAHLVQALKMPCVSSHLDQMVKMPPSYSSVVDEILMVRFCRGFVLLVLVRISCDFKHRLHVVSGETLGEELV